MKNDSHETRIALLEQSIKHVNETLIRMESHFDSRFDGVNSRFDGVNSRFDGVNSRFDKVDARLDKLDNRLWQIIFLVASSVIGLVLAKIFHWF